jgi:hypothetical protein
MAYREVHMTEIKEILLRVNRKQSVRSISKMLGIHRDTINKYINFALELGADPTKDAITDELIERIKQRILPGNKSSHIPRDDTLLVHKEKIEAHLGKGLKGSKRMIPSEIYKDLHIVRKTFLAKHLAFCALKDGYSVTFTRMDKFFKHLRLLAIDGTYERTISSYIRPDILVIVEMTR